jgi:hypothetical protein
MQKVWAHFPEENMIGMPEHGSPEGLEQGSESMVKQVSMDMLKQRQEKRPVQDSVDLPEQCPVELSWQGAASVHQNSTVVLGLVKGMRWYSVARKHTDDSTKTADGRFLTVSPSDDDDSLLDLMFDILMALEYLKSSSGDEELEGIPLHGSQRQWFCEEISSSSRQVSDGEIKKRIPPVGRQPLSKKDLSLIILMSQRGRIWAAQL